MPSHSAGPGIWLSVWRFLSTHCLYEQAAEVLARMRGCAGSPEPSLLAYAISTKFAWRCPNILFYCSRYINMNVAKYHCLFMLSYNYFHKISVPLTSCQLTIKLALNNWAQAGNITYWWCQRVTLIARVIVWRNVTMHVAFSRICQNSNWI